MNYRINKYTKRKTVHTMIKKEPKDIEEYDERKSHISSKLL
jgi:hypothetical protein